MPAQQETAQIGFRIPCALLERVDAYADRLSNERPPMKYTRTDALLILPTRVLKDVEDEARAKPRRGAR